MAKGNVDNKAFLDSPLGGSSKHLHQALSSSDQHDNDKHQDEYEKHKSSCLKRIAKYRNILSYSESDLT
jgi:hypothetical protein